MGKLRSRVWRFSRTPLKTPYAKSELRNRGPHLTYQTLALFSKTPDWIGFSVSLCNWPAFLTFLHSNQLLGGWSRRLEMPTVTPHDKPPAFPFHPAEWGSFCLWHNARLVNLQVFLFSFIWLHLGVSSRNNWVNNSMQWKGHTDASQTVHHGHELSHSERAGRRPWWRSSDSRAIGGEGRRTWDMETVVSGEATEPLQHVRGDGRLHAVPREHSADHKHVVRRDMKVYICHSITWEAEGRRIVAGFKTVRAME